MRWCAILIAAMSTAGCGVPDAVLFGERTVQERPQRSNVPEVRVTWLGVAGFWIEDGQDGVLIDPYVSRNIDVVDIALRRRIGADRERVADLVDRLGMQHAWVIVVSHSHFDHSLDAPEFARQTGATIIGSSSTAKIARAAGVRDGQIRVVEPEEEVRVGAFRVHLVQSAHGRALAGRVPWPGAIERLDGWPVPADELREGGTYGIVVAHSLGTIVHHGSAGWIDGMYAGVSADVVLLGLAGREDSRALLDAVVASTGAQRVIPMHFDDFFRREMRLSFLPFVGFGEFVRAFDTWAAGHGGDRRLVTLPPGQPRVLFRGR